MMAVVVVMRQCHPEFGLPLVVSEVPEGFCEYAIFSMILLAEPVNMILTFGFYASNIFNTRTLANDNINPGFVQWWTSGIIFVRV